MSGLDVAKQRPAGLMEINEIHPDRLIGALHGLDSAARAALELRYLHGIPVERTAELLDRAPSTVQGLLEDGVEGLLVALGLDSLDQGVALVLVLSKLPATTWGDRPMDEAVARVRDCLERRDSKSGGR
ncbi:MAG TPA: sigma factor-like helix-turn-helix DNA-binding protein [Solirubrobacterales bacterium]|nr:sigma factor-like helix-turn-helix DNA-binding protein [Solirubrobacterales bacterium]